MTQIISANRWRNLLLMLVGAGLLIMLALWAAGAVFLYWVNLDPRAATPVTLYQYYSVYGTNEAVADKLGLSAFSVITLALIAAAPVILPKKRSLHGDAAFATRSQIKKAGLFAKDGIIVGKIGEKYLVYGGADHVLLAAPTRSGKGVGVVIPNLLNWNDSCVVLDIKKENWEITSGFRQKYGHVCFLFSPAARDYKTHAWNPLFYITSDKNFRINDVQKIAWMLYPDNGDDPIWSGSARSLFLSIVLYLLDTDGMPVTIGEVYRQSVNNLESIESVIKERQRGDKPLSPECISGFLDYFDTSHNTRTSIRKTLTSRLELWSNPAIDAATASNDFDLRDLRRKRMSIYVGVTPGDLSRLAPIINLFFQQVIDLNTRDLPSPKNGLNHKVLLLLDEFAVVGRMDALSKGVSYVAGYGLRLLTIIQSPSQLRDPKLYGSEGADNIMENHALRVIFPPKDIKIAEEISNSLGFTTVKSRSRSKQLSGKGGRSYSESDQRRALLLPQEISLLGKQKEIIIMENYPPIKAERIRYFEDNVFVERLLDPAKVPTITISTHQDSTEIISNKEVIRSISSTDIENINNISLEEFSCDFSHITIPDGDISEEDMQTLVGEFFDAIGDAT